MDRRLVGLIAVAVSAAGFGSGALFAKGAYVEGMGFLALMSWRFLLGAAAGWTWILVSARRRAVARRMARRTVVIGLAIGALYVGNSGTYYAALERVPASIAALIVFTYPAIVGVLSLRFGRRLRGTRAWGALGLALLGCALTIGGLPDGAMPSPDALVLVSLSPIIYACWILLQAWLTGERRHRAGGEAEGDVDPAVAAALVNGGATIVYWPWALAVGAPVAPGAIPAGAWPFILGIGVLSSFIAILGFTEGSRRIGAARAALISTIEPVWTIVFAVLLLGDRLAPIQAVGGLLILVGVIVAQTDRTVDGDLPVEALPRVADE